MLSLERAKLSFLLKNKENTNFSFSAFEGFLVIGKTNHLWFLKGKSVKISFSEYNSFNNQIVSMIQFLGSKKNKKYENTEIKICENFYWIKKIQKEGQEIVKSIELKVLDCSIILDKFDYFFHFLKAFRILIIPSLNLSLNQSNFLLSLSALKKADLINLKQNSSQLQEYIVEIKRKGYLPINEYFSEIFHFYFEYLLIIESLSNLDNTLSNEV